MQRIIRVNMSDLAAKSVEAPEELKVLGGRGLTSKIISMEVPPNCAPLGPDAKIVLAPGLLTGTVAPCSGRLSIGAKSPLTGGIKESNVGGVAGQIIAKAGIKAIVIEGMPNEKHCYILEFNGEQVHIKEADSLKGKTNYQLADVLQADYGTQIPYLCVGPGAEQLFPIATVAVADMEGRPTRHAGRGGMGAVLASKGIKAIVFTNKNKGKLKAPKNVEAYRNVAKEFAVDLVNTKKALTKFGTAVLVNVINEHGALPVNNFRHGSFAGVEHISGEVLAKNCSERGGKTGHGCHSGCVIKCSNIYHDAHGKYLTSSLEYETIAMLGSNCGLQDMDQIAELDFLCDTYGLDTMETGSTFAVAMEGGLLEFGDFQGMKNLIEEMVRGTLTGKLLGQGALVTGKTLGVERIPVVKGQSISAYDPRALKGTGTTYATSPMGGDHTSGNCLPGRTGLDDKKANGQVKASKESQILTVLCDSLGLCIFVGPVQPNLVFFSRLLNSYLGTDLIEDEIKDIGLNIIKQEIQFNEKAGISKYQNDLPEFFRKEKLNSDLVFDVNQKELEKIFV